MLDVLNPNAVELSCLAPKAAVFAFLETTLLTVFDVFNPKPVVLSCIAPKSDTFVLLRGNTVAFGVQKL